MLVLSILWLQGGAWVIIPVSFDFYHLAQLLLPGPHPPCSYVDGVVSDSHILLSLIALPPGYKKRKRCSRVLKDTHTPKKLIFYLYNTIHYVAVIISCLCVWCNATIQNYSRYKTLWVRKQNLNITILQAWVKSCYFYWGIRHWFACLVQFFYRIRPMETLQFTFRKKNTHLLKALFVYIHKTVKLCAHDAKCFPSESAGHRNYAVWPN